MSFKHAAAIAAVLSIVAPSITPACATGSRLDRGENAERRKAKQAAAAAEAEAQAAVWHYAAGTASVGPLTQAELIAAAEAGKIKKDTQVFNPNAGWRNAAQVPELKDIAK